MPHTLTGTIAASFWLDGATRTISIPLSVIFDGGKMQDIPIPDDAPQGANETIYTGAGVDAWTLFAGVNYSGRLLSFDPNNTGNPVTLPPSPNPTDPAPLPGGVVLFGLCAADATAVATFGTLLYSAYFEIEDMGGPGGVFSLVALGSLLP